MLDQHKKYVLSMIVGKIRFGKVALLKNRSEVSKHLFNFISWLERKSASKFEVIHTDGLRIYSIRNVTITNGNWIPILSTIQPKSNRVAERFNRTIRTRARPLLNDSKLPLEYWGEAIIHATSLRNKTAAKVLLGSTPFEAFFGRKPDISLSKNFWMPGRRACTRTKTYEQILNKRS